MTRKIVLYMLIILSFPLASYSQWSIKNNLLYDAALTWNAGIENRISHHWTTALNVGYSPYKLGTNSTRRWRHLMVMPEARYWFCEAYARHFISMNAVYSHYNASKLNLPIYGTGDYRYQGDFVGAGASYGYAIAIGQNKHWNVEFEVGADLCYTWYDKYECEHCGDELGSENKWFVLPKLGVNLAWILPGEYFNKDRMHACEEVLPVESVPELMEVPAFVPQYDYIPDNIGKAGQLLQSNPILSHIDDYVPYTPDRILRKESNSLYVFFPLDKAILSEDFRHNRPVLDSIVSATRQIMADSISGVRKISIIGMASIEGAEAHNCSLGENRAQVLKEYIQRHVQVPDSLFDLANGCEAWSEFRDQLTDIRTLKKGEKVNALPGSPAAETLAALTPEVLAGISMEEVERVLAIVDEESDPARREQRIRQLNGGRTYDFLKQNLLEDQRNSGYLRVYYDYVPDKAAHSINGATAYLRQKRYNDALLELQPHSDDSRAWNALGVAYYMTGNIEKAL
ncbi:MAG: DUF3575 domain-containing protein, partial [Bacteroidaceae bacterium]|nr:DUF3575 domain-containing protein [Bacteroidaceae bacterium]